MKDKYSALEILWVDLLARSSAHFHEPSWGVQESKTPTSKQVRDWLGLIGLSEHSCP